MFKVEEELVGLYEVVSIKAEVIYNNIADVLLLLNLSISEM